MKRHLNKMIFGFVFAAAIGTANLASAATYDISNDFSLANNPNGVWTYGFSTTLGGSLTLYDVASTQSGLQFWQSSVVQTSGDPTDFNNPTANPITLSTLTVPGHTAA